MTRYVIKGYYEEVIYAENEEEAIEIFDGYLSKDNTGVLPFDGYEITSTRNVNKN